ncbi:MAG: arginine--tRNA ligase [FCB group bacterium]|nr:arginine--tRNA ligase [FCB group bacterium]
MSLKPYLIQALTEATKALNLPAVAVRIAPSKNPKFGDLSSNLALIVAKPAGKNPYDLALAIRDQLSLAEDKIAEVTVTPPGFINFKLSDHYYYSLLTTILDENQDFGRGTSGKGKRANVEFVSANPTGPLTVGHGRQAVLGDTVANILEWHGFDVTREYYYNDAGRQMRLLAESVAARYYQELGRDVPLPEDGYEGEYIVEIARHIIEQHGDDLPPGDPKFRAVAEEHIFNDIKASLIRMGIKHDQFTNEKSFYESGAINEFIDDLRAKGLIYEAEGAVWFKTTALGKAQDRVLIKSTGEPTYRLPDMVYHRNKLERGFDLIIDIFGADHQDTYPDVLIALEALGYDISHIRVLIHQFVTLVRGGEKVKMSTRKATFVTLEELINELGPDVVRFFFIMRGMNSHLNFDLDLAADQSEKNPVFYLQYAHARIVNIIRHGENLGYKFTTDYDPTLLTHPSELALLKKLDQFPDVMITALEVLEPQVVANYLQALATHFHKFYTECRVITEDHPLSQARLALISAIRIVLNSGLKILGVNAPERM